MDTRTFTYGGVNELASTAGNWDTVPADDDTIVIAAGSNCCWDVDTSAWPNGVAGLTITSHATTPASLYFKTSGTANYLKIKTGTTINGTNAAVKGRLIANGDGAWATTTVYPFAAKATIEFITTAYLDGTYLSLNIRCAEPATPVIHLSANEAAGQTELSVTENITADIWADGDLVSITDLQQTQEQETRVIAAGGRAAAALTVTTGLTAAKVAGTYPCKIALVTRNIKIIGGSGATQKCIANLAGTGHVVNAWMYCATASQGYAFDTCVGLTVSGGCVGPGAIGQNNGWNCGFVSCTVTWTGGTSSGNNYGFVSCTVTWIGGTSSGNANGFVSCTVTWTGGTSSGNTYGFSTCTVTWTGGTSSGNNYGFVSCTVTWIGGTSSGNANGFVSCTVTWTGGTSSGNTYGFSTCTVTWTGGTSSGNTYGFSTCTVTWTGGTSSGNAYDLRQCNFAQMYNAAMGGTTENYEYNTDWVTDNAYAESRDHDQVANAFKSWSRGGITISQTTTLPSGYTLGFKLTCENASKVGFRQTVYSVCPGGTLSVAGQIKFADDHSAYKPRLEIMDDSTDPVILASYTPLAQSIVASGTDTGWQAVSVSWKNTASITRLVRIRTSAMRASGDVYYVWAVNMDQPAVTDVRSGTSFNFGSTGTLAVPAASDVREGVAVDAGVGTMGESSLSIWDTRSRYQF